MFFIAGHETSSSALGFAFAMLADHPEVQERLVAEIREHVGEAEPHYEQIKKVCSAASAYPVRLISEQLEYMRWFFSETLRMWSPAPGVMRRATKDQVMGGYQILKGVRCTRMSACSLPAPPLLSSRCVALLTLLPQRIS